MKTNDIKNATTKIYLEAENTHPIASKKKRDAPVSSLYASGTANRV